MDWEKEREEQFLAMQNQVHDLDIKYRNLIAENRKLKENKMIELFLTDVKFHLSAKELPKFTFKGLVKETENVDKILKEIKADPNDCKLKCYIKLPEN